MLPARFHQNALIQALKCRLFALTGHKPSHRWYGTYRVREIKRILSTPFDPDKLASQHGRWLDERMVEYPWMFSRLPEGPGALLDAGSILNFDFALQHRKLRGKRITIMTLAPEEESFWKQGISYVYGDLRQTFFRDDHFDTVVSLSTLEHIGLDNTMFYTADKSKEERKPNTYLAAVKELRRVLKPGGLALLSVPFGKAVVRDWFQIFDAAMVQSIVESFQPKSHTIRYFQYNGSQGWQSSDASSAGDARYFDLHTDTPWPRCPPAAGAVACLELRE